MTSPSSSVAAKPLLIPDSAGLACELGGFHIDPMRPCELALITHAHADHARRGAARYIATEASVPILRHRLGDDIDITGVPYGERIPLGRTEVSFHPAGHVLGSAQIAISDGSRRTVATGDFKRDADPTCAPFEVVPCDTFVSEATFALPIYRWPATRMVARDIADWWQANADAGRPSVLFCYAFGKAQRVLAELTAFTSRSVWVHGAVHEITELYRNAGIEMLPTQRVDGREKRDYSGELIIAPPGAAGSRWMRRFKDALTGFCSGWMQVRGNRRRRGYDRGFVLSDHADWPGLLRTVEEVAPSKIYLMHGHADILVRLLRERGVDAGVLAELRHA
ncbi:MAG: ligase-associated DNA damage response exonuclease [Pseudomonadota bacterium]